MTVPGNLSSPLLAVAAAAADAGANITKSVRFNKDDGAYLSRTPSSAGNRKTWTWSGWVKLGREQGNDRYTLFECTENFPASGNPYGLLNIVSGMLGFGEATGGAYTTALFRDHASWYHIVAAMDTTQSTAADRLKLYVNGVQYSHSGYTFSQNADTAINQQNVKHSIGREENSDIFLADLYMADVYFIDGQQLDCTSFGSFDSNGVWQAAAFSGAYGTNGFHLFDFASESTVGHDSSGNENDFTANNISTSAGVGNDVLFDVPVNGDASNDTGAGGEVSGNYCTWNPLDSQLNFASLANGNLEHTGSSSGSYFSFSAGTIGFDSSTSTGFYFEVTQLTYGDSSSIGLHDTAYPVAGLDYGSWIGSSGNPNGISYVTSGTVYNFGSTISSQGTYTSNGDVIGVAVKDNKIWFSKNGTYISGNPSTGTSPTATLSSAKVLTPIINGFTSGVYALNAGQRAFNTAAPTGFKALCTSNLPTPTIADGSDYFDTTLYTGNGSTQTISGLEFSPDFVWIKSRGGLAGGSHQLYDQVRGATKRLRTNGTDAEVTQSTGLTAFTSDGFTVGNNSSSNYNNDPYVVWAWDAGTSNASNTDGTITTTVRANIAAGFSIVTYSGTDTGSSQTLGHGLGVAPKLWIFKNRSASSDWIVYTTAIDGGSDYAKLNATDAFAAGVSPWSTAPTSSVVTVGTNNVDTCNAGDDYVLYAFTPVAGYSAIGHFTSNNTTDNVFLYTGFAPRYIIWKITNTAGGWSIYDTARDPVNPNNTYLRANAADAEATATPGVMDFLSNGFKVRNTLGGTNSLIYMAFASNPFQANGGLAR